MLTTHNPIYQLGDFTSVYGYTAVSESCLSPGVSFPPQQSLRSLPCPSQSFPEVVWLGQAWGSNSGRPRAPQKEAIVSPVGERAGAIGYLH